MDDIHIEVLIEYLAVGQFYLYKCSGTGLNQIPMGPIFEFRMDTVYAS